jgi:hypothetical protein
MKWFEDFGISIMRGTNLVVFIIVLLAGIFAAMAAMEKGNAVYAVLFCFGGFFAAGLVTGFLSMISQMYESLVISKDTQLQILEQLKRLNNK